MRFKKSQITLFVIAGVVLIIIVSFVFYLRTSAVSKQGDSGKTTTQKMKLQLQPIEDYIVQCLNKVTKEGLVLLGRQAGYLYRSQGGLQIDFRDVFKGEIFINYPAGSEYKVPYGIHPLMQNIGKYRFGSPAYPWDEYPSDGAGGETFEGVFGIGSLQDINKLKQHMEFYIENNMKNCADWDIFVEYEITEGELDADFEIAKKDVSVRLAYPLIIKQKSTGDTTTMEEFFARQDVNIKEIYAAVDYLIEEDVTDIKFDIGNDASLRDGLSVEVIKDVYGQDDVIIVKDEKSLINNEPYEFVFARRNRMPALHYITPDSIPMTGGSIIKEDDLILGGMAALEADDPDEDGASISFSIYPSVPRRLLLSERPFDIKVTDGELEDYQTVTVVRT